MYMTESHGFNDDHVEYLNHMAHYLHGPTDFDDEVQKHLDKLYAPKQDVPPEFGASPDQQYAQGQKDEEDSIQNVSAGGPPRVPSPPSPVPGLPQRP